MDYLQSRRQASRGALFRKWPFSSGLGLTAERQARRGDVLAAMPGIDGMVPLVR
jgi:hypothetical protein